MGVRRSRVQILGTIALSLLTITAIIGGCTRSIPGVSRTIPNQGATDVSASPAIVQLTFDEPMATSSTQDAFRITPSVGTADSTYAWSEDNRTLTVTFPQSFAPDTQYTVEVGTDAKATNNVALREPFVLRFTTASGPAVGAGPTEEAAAKAGLSFASDIGPLAEARCKGCHADQMSNYNTITSEKWVVPGKPDQSSYYRKPAGIVEHGGGNVWKDKADLVRRWITAGASK